MRTLSLLIALVALYPLLAEYYVAVIYNPNNYTLTNYQLRVKLPSELNGSALTLVDANGNSVPFCYETLTGECTTDPSQGNGYIWVKVPYLPANGNATLLIEVGTNGAVSGDQVFDFYDDFNSYPNGPFDGGGKWIVNRYWGDYNTECVIENGILWLVKRSQYRGCNIRASNFSVKYDDRVIVEFRFKVDYVCGNSNDGDGLALIIDGSDDEAYESCFKGFDTTGQGIAVEIYTGDSNDGYIGIGPHNSNCNPTDTYIDVGPKADNLNLGVVKVMLTGQEVNVTYYDENPEGGNVVKSVSRDLWDPQGSGYLMLGAGTGDSCCYYCGNDDSAHGVDWIRVRKYAEKEPVVTIRLLFPELLTPYAIVPAGVPSAVPLIFENLDPMPLTLTLRANGFKIIPETLTILPKSRATALATVSIPIETITTLTITGLSEGLTTTYKLQVNVKFSNLTISEIYQRSLGGVIGLYMPSQDKVVVITNDGFLILSWPMLETVANASVNVRCFSFDSDKFMVGSNTTLFIYDYNGNLIRNVSLTEIGIPSSASLSSCGLEGDVMAFGTDTGYIGFYDGSWKVLQPAATEISSVAYHGGYLYYVAGDSLYRTEGTLVSNVESGVLKVASCGKLAILYANGTFEIGGVTYAKNAVNFYLNPGCSAFIRSTQGGLVISQNVTGFLNAELATINGYRIVYYSLGTLVSGVIAKISYPAFVTTTTRVIEVTQTNINLVTSKKLPVALIVIAIAVGVRRWRR